VGKFGGLFGLIGCGRKKGGNMKKKMKVPKNEGLCFDLIKDIPESEIQAAIDRAYKYWTEPLKKSSPKKKTQRKERK
jgi:hypothetical protein